MGRHPENSHQSTADGCKGIAMGGTKCIDKIHSGLPCCPSPSLTSSLWVVGSQKRDDEGWLPAFCRTPPFLLPSHYNATDQPSLKLLVHPMTLSLFILSGIYIFTLLDSD